MKAAAALIAVLLSGQAIALDVGTYRSLKRGDPQRAAAYVDGLADMITAASKAKLDRVPFDDFSICVPSGQVLTGRMLGALLEKQFEATERSSIASRLSSTDLPSLAYNVAVQEYPLPMMRGIGHFLGANLFLLAMLAAGAAVVIALVRLAQLAGATDDMMIWLYWPIGMAGIVVTYYAGKLAHRTLAKLV